MESNIAAGHTIGSNAASDAYSISPRVPLSRDADATRGSSSIADQPEAAGVAVVLQEVPAHFRQVVGGTREHNCHLSLDERVFDDVVEACEALFIGDFDRGVVGEQDVCNFMVQEALRGDQQIVARIFRNVGNVHHLRRTVRVIGNLGVIDHAAAYVPRPPRSWRSECSELVANISFQIRGVS
jgi:hypothetical protein